jgi:ribosomal protein L28
MKTYAYRGSMSDPIDIRILSYTPLRRRSNSKIHALVQALVNGQVCWYWFLSDERHYYRANDYKLPLSTSLLAALREWAASWPNGQLEARQVGIDGWYHEFACPYCADIHYHGMSAAQPIRLTSAHCRHNYWLDWANRHHRYHLVSTSRREWKANAQRHHVIGVLGGQLVDLDTSPEVLREAEMVAHFGANRLNHMHPYDRFCEQARGC